MKPATPLTAARLFAAFLIAAFSLACDSNTEPAGSGGVSFSTVATPAALPAGAAVGAGELTQTDGEHTLVITRVAVVLREIELERVEDNDCPDGVEEDDCEEFEVGPTLLEMGLEGTVEQVVAIQAPAGSYDELEFDIHKPEDDTPEDLAFIAANPDFERVSIRVEGTFDGEDFLFLQDLNEEQELDLSPPLEVAEGAATTNVTLQLDVTTWFVRSDGSLIDPGTANKGGPNESLVEQNIENSIEAFEDDDHDGDDDHHGHDGDGGHHGS